MISENANVFFAFVSKVNSLVYYQSINFLWKGQISRNSEVRHASTKLKGVPTGKPNLCL